MFDTNVHKSWSGPGRRFVFERGADMHLAIGIIAAIVIFGILVVVHEGGHFATAKAVGVRVNEFSIGMGPLLFSGKKGETMYSLRLLPIGGYVALEGEDEESDDERSFSNKPAWAKLLVLAAGPFMNFLFAVIVLTVLLMVIGGPTNVFQALVLGFKNCVNMEIMIFDALKDLITGAGSVDDVVGPIGIVDAVDKTAQAGMSNLVLLTVVLSLNLGLFNILPFPALDGGRILFVIIRAVTGKAITDEMENKIHYVGIMILFGLMILITMKDVNTFFLK